LVDQNFQDASDPLQITNGTPAVKLERKATDLEAIGNPQGRALDITGSSLPQDIGKGTMSEGRTDLSGIMSPTTDFGAERLPGNSKLTGKEEDQAQIASTMTSDQISQSKETKDVQPASSLTKRLTDASTNSTIRLVRSTNTQSSLRVNSFASISDVPAKKILVFDETEKRWHARRKHEIRGEFAHYLLKVPCNDIIL
jgi:hypothetical protein